MATVLITPADLAPFADISADKAEAMIEDVTAVAFRVAPCLKTATDDDVTAAARAVLRAAILRWNDAGSGEVTQQTSGPFTTTYSQQARKSIFWPSEIEALQDLCSEGKSSRAFEVDLMPKNAMQTDGWWSDPITWNTP